MVIPITGCLSMSLEPMSTGKPCCYAATLLLSRTSSFLVTFIKAKTEEIEILQLNGMIWAEKTY